MDQNQPKNYLVESILATIFCCQPFGIVSIVFASQVNSKFAAGDFKGAQKASKKAKNWLMWAVISGLVVGVGFLIFYGSIVAAFISGNSF